MQRYPLHPDFRRYARLRFPLNRAVLPVCNAFLGLAGRLVLSDGKTKVKRLRIPAEGGGARPAHIGALLIEPIGLDEPMPCLIYFHGGGFVMKSAPCHVAMAREYAARVPCKALFVDYRLAPKHPFPVPAEDCFAACLWALENAAVLGIDPARTAVGGDSAGGNLAAAVCLMARDRGAPCPRAQMLVYPATDRRMNTPSMAAFYDAPMWNSRLNAKMWRWLLPDPTVENLAYASPMEAASLRGLPPAYVETAQFDCLRDEGNAYALALREAGNAAELWQVKGAMHGYDVAAHSPILRDCVERRVRFLQRHLS